MEENSAEWWKYQHDAKKAELDKLNPRLDHAEYEIKRLREQLATEHEERYTSVVAEKDRLLKLHADASKLVEQREKELLNVVTGHKETVDALQKQIAELQLQVTGSGTVVVG